MNKTFENYLEDEFMKDYHGVKDDAYDAFNAWVDRLEVSDVLAIAENTVKELNDSYDRLRVLADKLEALNEKAIDELKHIGSLSSGLDEKTVNEMAKQHV